MGRRGDADLRDQAVRSARSVVLNIAEGSGKAGRARRHSFTLALGEAGEACSAILAARHLQLGRTEEGIAVVGGCCEGLPVTRRSR